MADARLRHTISAFRAVAEVSASVSWAVQNRSIWRVMIGVRGGDIRTEQTIHSSPAIF
jgi:hypothetical protein